METGAGRDDVAGGPGDDILRSGDGDDQLSGYGGDPDQPVVNPGNDQLDAGAGDDELDDGDDGFKNLGPPDVDRDVLIGGPGRVQLARLPRLGRHGVALPGHGRRLGRRAFEGHCCRSGAALGRRDGCGVRRGPRERQRQSPKSPLCGSGQQARSADLER